MKSGKNFVLGLLFLACASVAVYDFTRRVGEAHLGKVTSPLLAVIFGYWGFYYLRKYRQSKSVGTTRDYKSMSIRKRISSACFLPLFQ
jgi:hypothetical protein